MQRRKPARVRMGTASFGRRVPHCNFAEIRAEIEAMSNISVINFNDQSSSIHNQPQNCESKDPSFTQVTYLKSALNNLRSV